MGGGAGKEKYKAHGQALPLLTFTNSEPKKPRKVERPGLDALCLTADVGGTSSRLHLWRAPSELDAMLVPNACIIKSQKYQNEKFDTFEEVLNDFLSSCKLEHPPYLACFAVAGVVVDNTCNLVNLGWRMDGDEICDKLGFSQVHLINDFEAQGYGILTLDVDQECEVLNDAPVISGAPMAVLGAGTGLGEAFLTTGHNGDYEVWPTEGGHAEFAPRQHGSDKLQFELCNYLMIKFSAKARISVERIVSGKGIANIYQFLAWKYPDKVSKTVHREFLGAVDMHAKNDPAAIVQAARSGECELATQAMDIFTSAYGAEAGVLALQYMPFGGLFVTGGVTCKTRDFITGEKGAEQSFMNAFLDKGRVTPMLMRVPVFLVKGEDMGERGIKLKAIRMLREAHNSRMPSKGHMCNSCW